MQEGGRHDLMYTWRDYIYMSIYVWIFRDKCWNFCDLSLSPFLTPSLTHTFPHPPLSLCTSSPSLDPYLLTLSFCSFSFSLSLPPSLPLPLPLAPLSSSIHPTPSFPLSISPSPSPFVPLSSFRLTHPQEQCVRQLRFHDNNNDNTTTTTITTTTTTITITTTTATTYPTNASQWPSCQRVSLESNIVWYIYIYIYRERERERDRERERESCRRGRRRLGPPCLNIIIYCQVLKDVYTMVFM